MLAVGEEIISQYFISLPKLFLCRDSNAFPHPPVRQLDNKSILDNQIGKLLSTSKSDKSKLPINRMLAEFTNSRQAPWQVHDTNLIVSLFDRLADYYERFVFFFLHKKKSINYIIPEKIPRAGLTHASCSNNSFDLSNRIKWKY